MPRDGTATRERILDTAQRLVLDQGFAATSVDEIIDAAESSKGAFFNHFATKNDLARALVERYAAADIGLLETFMAEAEAESDDPALQLIAFVRLFEEAADEIVAAQPSCLYVSFIYDRQLYEDGTTDLIVSAVDAWRTALHVKLQAGAQLHPPRSDVDLEALADHVFVTFEGAFILARTTGDGSHMRKQLAVLRHHLELLFNFLASEST